MNKSISLTIASSLLIAAGGAYADGGHAQDFAPFVADSMKVQSTSDRGATADHTSCFDAPDNYGFLPTTLAVSELSAVGKNRRCVIDAPTELVDVQTTGGLTIQVPVAHKVCVTAHSETGSGYGSIGRTAWVQCQLTGKWQQYR